MVKGHNCYDIVSSSNGIVSQHIQELMCTYFKIENVVFNGEQLKEYIICVRVG